ncbi:hypothetical protein [Fodinicola acaciae]|uniref:hypothetical protein n=1 Tax=Fodinicola acaciae TaxID=2681555 RepID=UPI0013D14DD9|nr:hypothetical protein [Fodinicola acaciae]
MDVYGNPNEVHLAGQHATSAADAAQSVRGGFAQAASRAEAAAVEGRLPAAYGKFHDENLDRLNKVLTLAGNAGLNIQTGAAALVATDQQASAGFSQAHSIMPPINGPRRAS